MKPLLVITHAAEEGLGTMAPFLREQGIPVEICHTYLGESVPADTTNHAGLIVMGGSMNVDEDEKFPFLAHECSLIQHAIRSKKTVLGICLGAQLIAKALGAKIYRGKIKEVGWSPIYLTEAGRRDPALSVFAAAPDDTVFHWHGDSFPLPKDARLLASSDLYANQAFSFEELAYGLQFHIEMTQGMINKWVIADANWLKTAPLKNPAKTIIDASKMYLFRLERTAGIFYRKFFEHVGLLKRKTINTVKAPND